MEVVVPPCGHLAMYGDIFVCRSWCGMPQASIEWVAVTLSTP